MDEVLVKMHLSNALAANKSGEDDYEIEEHAEIRDLDVLKQTTPGGVYLGIYEVLYTNQAASKINMYLPQTVVFRFNRPMAWYNSYYDPIEKRFVIRKKRQSSLKNALVLASFLGAVKDPLVAGLQAKAMEGGGNTTEAEAETATDPKSNDEKPFIAYFVSSDGIRYLDRDDIQSFLLLSKSKLDGILQQLEAPMSKLTVRGTYEMVRCSWTPIISYVERRRNLYTFHGVTLRDKNTDQHSRVETFEGKDYTTSQEAPVTSKKNLSSIKSQCVLMADHFQRVSGNRLGIQGMMANMKIKENARLMFLWADSMCIAGLDAETGQIQASQADYYNNNSRQGTPSAGNRTAQSSMVPSAVTTPRSSVRMPILQNQQQQQRNRHSGTLSLETRHKMHESVEERGKEKCTFCNEMVAKKEFLEVPYHTLMSAKNEIWWSSSQREARTLQLQRMKLASQGGRGPPRGSTPAPLPANRGGKWSSSLVASTNGGGGTSLSSTMRGNKGLPTASSEIETTTDLSKKFSRDAWKYEAFTNESFTKPLMYQISSKDIEVPPEAQFVHIPAFVRALHPYMTADQFLGLRGREDFRNTTCRMCSSCFFSATESFSSTSSKIAKVFKDELFEEEVKRAQKNGSPKTVSLSMVIEAEKRRSPTLGENYSSSPLSPGRSGASTDIYSSWENRTSSIILPPELATSTEGCPLQDSGMLSNAASPSRPVSRTGATSKCSSQLLVSPVKRPLLKEEEEEVKEQSTSTKLKLDEPLHPSFTPEPDMGMTMTMTDKSLFGSLGNTWRSSSTPLIARPKEKSLGEKLREELSRVGEEKRTAQERKRAKKRERLGKHVLSSEDYPSCSDRLTVMSSSFVADWHPSSLDLDAYQKTRSVNPKTCLWARMRTMAQKERGTKKKL